MFTDPVSLYHTRERANDLAHRTIFCTYWLYFFGFRGLLGGIRVLDYLGMSLVVLGLILLVATKRLNLRFVVWVTALMCPLFLAIVLEQDINAIFFVLKTYVVALYIVFYFRRMRLTLVECVCFAVPVVVSVYYFLYPRPSDELYLLSGRMAGIIEPNFTSLSLIYSMCGAFGIYVLTGTRRAKVAAIVTVIVCLIGVILTASRAGFIGIMIALCLFLVIEKKMRYAGVVVAVATVIIALNSGVAFQNRLFVLQRFETASIDQRSFTVRAWDETLHGKWFIGGGPQRVMKWAKDSGLQVPHNSLLDIGVGFGKASFYFYSAVLVVLLAVNVRVVIAHRRYGSHEDKGTLLASVLFLSSLPMYMSLSAGFAMDLILWMVLGAYPLLHKSSKCAIVSRKKPLYCSAKLQSTLVYWDGCSSYEL